ncbi:MAG TPA: fused MFS/spermidine synthase [Thermoanaerobaculia bacterium]|nr:fused MFS/spermidine synthase [Thermoanaerobaculia bacterium]
MPQKTWMAAAFLFCSGAAALIYQTVWLREFRLIFGASTFATAAVLAMFMGGLGAGSAILGRRADERAAPLAFYGMLEIGVALSAALSPILLILIRKLYIALGGSVTLGLTIATLVRLIFATAVLGIPTFLMGGTLPAAARAVETDDDGGRRNLALLYGTNTLGAVTGTLVSTFFLLERFGNRRTLLAAVALNLLIGLLAWGLGRDTRTRGLAVQQSESGSPRVLASPRRPVLVSSAIVGFAFLLMELVWYRMLTPLLGGTTFTFGLILAAALLGIGLGGAAYSLWSGTRSPSAGAFAVTCTLEALAIIFPFALGDRLAVLANLLRALGQIGFGGDLIAWSLITLVVVFPAAFIAGVQFPILIALLGRGREDVGRDVGLAYAWNTGGAIAGSLAGGFGLLPLLSAPGCWRLAAVLLVLLGVVFAIGNRHLVAIAIGLIAIAGIASQGPTSVWRHTGIGAGRAPDTTDRNSIQAWIRSTKRSLLWDVDGRESSIAVLDSNDRVFMVNGKADGSARGDAGTQVMSGMVGAIVHRNPRTTLVIGLGTGSTAGWLGSIPSMEHVDVVELEPSVLRVAHDNAAVNHDVLRNPKVRIRIGDAREVLLTTPRHYDIIFSEPSNPYRAGIASLYTKEFYEAAAARLNRGGIFLQWVQAYDVDAQTIRTIYATAHSVFPYIDTFRTTETDLLFVSSREPLVYDIDMIRQRLSQDPYASAIHRAWRVESAEGFFSAFIGSDKVPVAIGPVAQLNTDDRTPIEFGFARGLGDRSRFDINQLISFARGIGADRPSRVRGIVDWQQVEWNRWHDTTIEVSPLERDPQVRIRAEFTKLYEENDLAGALAAWERTPFTPVNSIEVSRLAEVLAEAGREQAVAMAERLRPADTTEADAILARVRMRQRRDAESAAALERALLRYRTDPWPASEPMGRALDTAISLARFDHRLAPRLYALLGKPFSTGQWADERKIYRVHVAQAGFGCGPQTIAALRDLEPDFPWAYDLLNTRRRCYAEAHLGGLSARAERDWRDYESTEPQPLIPKSLSGVSSDR